MRASSSSLPGCASATSPTDSMPCSTTPPAPSRPIWIELGYLPFERRSAHLFFQLVARRYERGSLLITTNQVVTQWGTVFGDDVLAAAILDRLHPRRDALIHVAPE
jgi:IstB-like ATP binding protein